MPDTLAMEPIEDYSEDLAEERASAKKNMLRKEGRLPGQDHMSIGGLWVLPLAILNDLLDLVELGELTLVLAIPIKVALITLDISSALIIMGWGASHGKGFFSSRRIVMFIATVGAEFLPLAGIIPAWTIFVASSYVMQRFREKTVKTIAKVSPRLAEKAATRLAAVQRSIEGKAAAMGGGANTPSLVGTSGEARLSALAARRDAGARLASRAREDVLNPVKDAYEELSPGSSAELSSSFNDRIIPKSLRTIEKIQRGFGAGSGREQEKHPDIQKNNDLKKAA